MDFRNPYTNPYGFPQSLYAGMGQGQMPQAQPLTLNRVTGIDGARAFACPPNSVVALFDDTRDVFYVKSTDSGGFPTVRAFAFTPLEEGAPGGGGMTREEIESMIREEVARYGQQLVPGAPVAEQSGRGKRSE